MGDGKSSSLPFEALKQGCERRDEKDRIELLKAKKGKFLVKSFNTFLCKLFKIRSVNKIRVLCLGSNLRKSLDFGSIKERMVFGEMILSLQGRR